MRTRRIHLALIAALAVLAGCGGGDDDGGPDVLTVYVSLPLSGPAAAEGRDAADGARLALALAGGEAGGTQVEARFLDAGEPGRGWTPGRSARNARTATRDSTAIAYVGDFHSGASRASLPITNQAFMLQVSPASGAWDLVSELPGSDEVSELQPTGERTFGRVIPSDAEQAAAAAAWAKELGWKRVTVISDGSPVGRILSDEFRGAANQVGLETGPGGRDAFLAGTAPALLTQRSDEDFPFGSPSALTGMASDAFLPPYAPLTRAPELAVSAAFDPTDLPPAGREFPAEFVDEYGRRPGRYAAYGYEAMAVVLDSIERADDPADRRDVVDAFFETTDRDSILGPYSITETGETTLGRMTGYELRGGETRPLTTLVAP